ncbi:hypothetical protein SK3146_03580 [Paenibacillus konkukensis]|uniref:Polysaccharide biosynthesis protein n=1 Tax=Paenibacillus konkukensis TaxID=2020716 RepID=A0ABY4RRI7_9BACL|nr:hypothetical protein [Paenibacillus konkukensis]UQZ84334.1 hypothetical protein SK3146_03580 [Paenibacillus konkukensis]
MDRSKLVFLNASVVFFTTIVNLVLGMIEVRLYLKTYGEQLNGLLQTGNQVLGYLSLIESGLCAAYLYSLYKPMGLQDYSKVSSLYVGFLKTMKRIVGKMLVAAVVISALYPFLIKDKSLEYGTMFSVFILLSLRIIMPYWFNIVPKYMIILKEQKYKAELISGMGSTLVFLIEIFLVLIWQPKIQILLIIGVLMNLLISILFKKLMKQLYANQIDFNVSPNYEPNKMSKDLLAHNVSALVFNSTNNIVLSMAGTLSQVFVYSAYNTVTSQVVSLIQRIIDGTSVTIGLKISRNETSSYFVYREILAGSFFIGGTITSVFIVMVNPFIGLWIGTKYELSNLDVCLFGLVLYANIILPSIYVARNAKGLFRESRNFTVVQALLNLIITLVLVPFMGITGALLGAVVARWFVGIPMNYQLVYKGVFPNEKSRWIEWFGNLLILSIVVILSYQLQLLVFHFFYENDLKSFVLQTFGVSGFSFCSFVIYYWATDKGFRGLVKRILKRAVR